MNERLLICTIGLPRSGKTTWAKQQGHPIVNPDSIRLALHGQRFIVLSEPFVWAITYLMIRALFLAGHDTVIVDATNTTQKRRSPYIEQFSDMARIEWKIIPADKDECVRRARILNDEEIIPIIERMAEQSDYASLPPEGGD